MHKAFWPLSWIIAPLTWLALQLGLNKSFHTAGPALRDTVLHRCGRICIDTSFHLYTRNVCRARPPQSHYDWRGETRLEAATNWCNCDDATASLELLERDYLLVSTSQRKVIGIMPYPPYVNWADHGTRRAYLYDRALFRHQNLVNIWWANRFHFGIIDPDGRTIRFKHKNNGEANLWKYSIGNGELRIDSVIWTRDNSKTVPFASNDVAGFPTVFKRQPDGYTLGFQSAIDTTYKTALEQSYNVRAPYVIYISKYKGKKARYLVRFETIPDAKDTVAVASFDDPTVASSPEPLLEVPFAVDVDD